MGNNLNDGLKSKNKMLTIEEINILKDLISKVEKLVQEYYKLFLWQDFSSTLEGWQLDEDKICIQYSYYSKEEERFEEVYVTIEQLNNKYFDKSIASKGYVLTKSNEWFDKEVDDYNDFDDEDFWPINDEGSQSAVSKMHEAFSGFSLGEMSSDEIHHKLKSSFENFFNIELYPDALNDPRLEYSFKSPDCREPEMLPAIWKDYGYEETADGVKIISAKSAKIASDVYLHYVDEETIVWDADRKEMFLYIPDMENPRLAFKGTSWICARKLKDEYSHLNLYDVYMEIKRTIDQDRINN